MPLCTYDFDLIFTIIYATYLLIRESLIFLYLSLILYLGFFLSYFIDWPLVLII